MTRLIDADKLKKALSEPLYRSTIKDFGEVIEYTHIMNTIDNAPTVEVPENEVNCVLTMFDKCSYNDMGDNKMISCDNCIHNPVCEWKNYNHDKSKCEYYIPITAIEFKHIKSLGGTDTVEEEC